MPPADVVPHLGPGVVSFVDAPLVAAEAAIGTADDAMLVAGCRKRIRNDGRLLEQGDLNAALHEGPGRREAVDSGADDNHMHQNTFSAGGW